MPFPSKEECLQAQVKLGNLEGRPRQAKAPELALQEWRDGGARFSPPWYREFIVTHLKENPAKVSGATPDHFEGYWLLGPT